ncbi:hypothetical protein C7974DRAFT_425104 [Boeremia exigua]|uniref:uncharacterized protein n=1 Tax=Boeremia exigua TaxID=749465 RepID=UPI001E8CCF0D|nr:uncharacterized protein C7974DRAFT_425104 [Boeremia exigua]KAH6625430.1 hypothetical protein C7974DRAFT_425104 [Boeremia exigua]
MPPRKHKSTSKAKWQKPPPQQHSDGDHAIDLTAQNAIQSPLLRLPAELRNKIWQLLYGDQHLEVAICRWDRKDFDMEFSILRREPGLSVSWERPVHVPKPFCRQAWSESMAVFFSSAVFHFRDVTRLRRLISSLPHQPLVSRIQRIGLAGFILRQHEWMGLHGKLDMVTVGKIVSLKGLEWSMVVEQEDAQLLAQMNHDTLWESLQLAKMVEMFQQHKLREDLTTVTIHDYTGYPFPGNVAALSDKLRRRLLEHTPRRYSRRGRGRMSSP